MLENIDSLMSKINKINNFVLSFLRRELYWQKDKKIQKRKRHPNLLTLKRS